MAAGSRPHISREQFDYTVDAVAQRGLQDRITVLFDDYRDLTGKFDKLVSIEMIEAVGHQFYDTYFQTVSRLLKPHGKAVIQAITMTEQRYEQARDSVDFIKRYIFPGGCLPSLTVISNALARMTDMQMANLRDITRDYADTLNAWHEGFLGSLTECAAWALTIGLSICGATTSAIARGLPRAHHWHLPNHHDQAGVPPRLIYRLCCCP